VPSLSPLATAGAVGFATLTAFANAAAVTTQHIASQRPKGSARGAALARSVLRQPLWWFGGMALFGSLIFQSVALHFGPLSLVQPFLITEVLMALVLRQFWRHQSLPSRAWTAGVIVVVTLTAFLLVSAPSAGTTHTSLHTWGWVMGVTLVVLALLAAMGHRGSSRLRAGSWGSITAVLWALEAALIKETTDSLTTFGLIGSLHHWPVYAFVLIGVAGLGAEQTALFVGPLAVSQPCIVIVDPLASILFGALLFHERWRAGVGSVSLSVLLLLALCVSAYQLMAATPDGMDA